MKKPPMFASVCTLVFSIYSATSQAVTFNYSGAVTSSGHPGIGAGTLFSGQISYADNIPVIGSNSYSTSYGPVDISLSIAGQDINFSSGFVGIANDGLDDPFGIPFWDYVDFLDFSSQPGIAGVPLNFFELSLVESDGSAVDNTNLIVSFDTLNNLFPTKVLNLDFGTFNVTGTAQLAPVPIPAALWLFGSGLLGLIGVVRRKKVS